MNHWNSQKSAAWGCFSKQVVLKILQYSQENTCAGVSFLKSCLFLKKRLQPRFFCGYCKIFKNNSFIKNLPCLLLNVLPQYSKVSWGICFLNSRFHVLSNLIKNLHKTLHKWFLTITWQNNFFLAWIDLSRAFDFRICSGKTFIAFDFDGKLTQNVAQITMCQIAQNTNISCEKTFFACTLRLINFRTWFGKGKNVV